MRTSFGKRLFYAVPILVKDTDQARVEYEQKTGELYGDTKIFGWIKTIVLVFVIFAAVLGYLRSNFGLFQLRNSPSEDDYYRSSISCGVGQCQNSDCLLIYTKPFPNGKYKDEIYNVLERKRNSLECTPNHPKTDVPPKIGLVDPSTPIEKQPAPPQPPVQPRKGIEITSERMRNEGLRSQSKSRISIHVNTDGTSSVGDRAAIYLKNWLIQHGFNVTDDDAVLDVFVTGEASDHRNYGRSRDEASANLHLFMRWGDGEPYFDQDIPSSVEMAPFADTAKELAFSAALSRLLEDFRTKIQH